MPLNFYSTFTLFIFSLSVLAQERIPATFGQLSAKDIEFSSYPEDERAKAVILYEKGNVSVDVVDDYIILIKETHIKIKVLDPNNFQGSTIQIPYYNDKKAKEKIVDLTAITHNGNHQTYVSDQQIYDKDETDVWSSKSFTFPAVKKGSVLEYKYTVQSPFFSTFEWGLQDKIPTLYSEFVTEIPGNYSYRGALTGKQKFDYNESKIKRNCFSLSGLDKAGDCLINEYIMKNIPAFYEEDYMLSSDNYLIKIKYDLKQRQGIYGEKTSYTKTWKDVDDEYRYDKDMGRQLNYTSYFEDRIPAEILNITDPLARAKAVFYFIQKHFTWDGKYRIYSNIRVKDAFESKVGNSAEINLALINALRAANLDVELSLSSTRNRKIPNQIYPVQTEFNYVMAFLRIGDRSYFLDATDKYASFSVVPLRALNLVARIMDFENGSYWQPIEPFNRNIIYSHLQLELDNNGIIGGTVEENNAGQFALRKRDEMSETSKENYLNEKLQRAPFSNLTNYLVTNRFKSDKSVKEKYTVQLEPESINGEIYFEPFFLSDGFSENPFQLETRDYPVNLGFPINYTYLMALQISEEYEVINIPENKLIKFPDNSAECVVNYTLDGSKLNLRFNLKINNHIYPPENYPALKDFFEKVVDIQTKEPIGFKKR